MGSGPVAQGRRRGAQVVQVHDVADDASRRPTAAEGVAPSGPRVV